MRLTIIKLGGSILTDKSGLKQINMKDLTSAVGQLTSLSGRGILVHGAGSFAHPLAKEYQVTDGIHEPPGLKEQVIGISKIRTSLQQLHQFILEAMRSEGLKPFSIPVSATMITAGPDHVQKFELEPLRRAIEMGFLPVLYGDMVFDDLSTFRVVSGDRIILELTKSLEQYDIDIIFGGDVDGVYDKDPNDPDASIYSEIRYHELPDIIEGAGGSAGTDVTGGMKGKLAKIGKLLDLKVPVSVVHAAKDRRLASLLEGGHPPATYFKPVEIDR